MRLIKHPPYLLLTYLLLSLIILSCTEKKQFHFTGKTMGTSYSVVIADSIVDSGILEETKERVEYVLANVNRQMSTWDPESEIAIFNKKTDKQPMTVSPNFIKVLKMAEQIYLESEGAFDPTVGPLVNLWGFGKEGSRFSPPSDEEVEKCRRFVGYNLIDIVDNTKIAKKHAETQLDLSAIAKGFGVDMVADLLNKLGYKNFMVEIGGEVVVSGQKKSGQWRIGIDRPYFDAVPGENLEAILEVSNISVATSGDYRNYFVSGDKTYSHTIDPVSGKPIINGVASVTVIAPKCVVADAMATAIMVMGVEKGLAWVRSKDNVEIFIIVRTDEGYEEEFSPGFEKYLSN